MAANTNPFVIGPKLLGVDPTLVHTAAEGAKHELGLELFFNDGTTRKYIRAGAAIAANDALKIDFAEGANDFDPTGAVNQALAGVAPFAIADNGFGWVIVQGPANVKVAAAVTAGAHLGSTATAGTLDDVTVAGAAYAQGEAQATHAIASGKAFFVVADDTPSAGIASVVIL